MMEDYIPIAALNQYEYCSHRCWRMCCLGDFVEIGEAEFVEGFVFLGLHWKQGLCPVVVCGLGLGVGLGIELLGTHL